MTQENGRIKNGVHGEKSRRAYEYSDDTSAAMLLLEYAVEKVHWPETTTVVSN